MSIETLSRPAAGAEAPSDEALFEILARAAAGDHDVEDPAGVGRHAEIARAVVRALHRAKLRQLDNLVDFSIEANEIAISCARILRSTEEIGGRAQSIAVAGEQLSASIDHIDESVAETAAFSAKALETAHVGRESADAAAGSMDRIAETVGAAVSQIDSLAHASKEIDVIVGAIDEIAQQTSLLAVNASIEAARAGPAGRGFAIVAGEVKKLSDQTTGATRDIRSRIEALQTEVAEIVKSMGAGAETIKEGHEKVIAFDRDMNIVAEQVQQLERNLSDISSSVSEEKTASNAMATDVVGIDGDCQVDLDQVKRVHAGVGRTVAQISRALADAELQSVAGSVLRLAKADHVIWKKRLIDGFLGHVALSPDELSSHRFCRFGKWYYSEEAAPYRHLSAFRAIERPHQAVHARGVEAARLIEARKHDEALEVIREVEAASTEVLRLLDEMIRSEDAARR